MHINVCLQCGNGGAIGADDLCFICAKKNKQANIRIERLESLGHTNHCAYRQVSGDGECNCELNDRWRELSKRKQTKENTKLKGRKTMGDKTINLDIPKEVQAALKLLLNHAIGDSGGSKRCAMFLLSLWDGDTYKADLQMLLYVDDDCFAAMMRVLQYLYGCNEQLYSLVSEAQIKPVLDVWGKDTTTG